MYASLRILRAADVLRLRQRRLRGLARIQPLHRPRQRHPAFVDLRFTQDSARPVELCLQAVEVGFEAAVLFEEFFEGELDSPAGGFATQERGQR